MEVDVCYSSIKITNKQNKVRLNKAFNLLKAFFFVSSLALMVEIVLKSIHAKRGRPPLTMQNSLQFTTTSWRKRPLDLVAEH